MYGHIGGSSLDDAIRRMMPHLLSQNLAVLFNPHGRNHYGRNKSKFRDLRLYDVIYGKFAY